jgi:hypothetical protein
MAQVFHVKKKRATLSWQSRNALASQFMRRRHTKINQARAAQPLKADVGSLAAKAQFVHVV